MKYDPREALIEALAIATYERESLNCKTIDQACFHKAQWRRAIPECRKLLDRAEAIMIAEAQEQPPPQLEDAIHHCRMAKVILALEDKAAGVLHQCPSHTQTIQELSAILARLEPKP